MGSKEAGLHLPPCGGLQELQVWAWEEGGMDSWADPGPVLHGAQGQRGRRAGPGGAIQPHRQWGALWLLRVGGEVTVLPVCMWSEGA